MCFSLETNGTTNKRSSCDNGHGKRQSFWKTVGCPRILRDERVYSTDLPITLVIGIGSAERASCLLYEPFLLRQKEKIKITFSRALYAYPSAKPSPARSCSARWKTRRLRNASEGERHNARYCTIRIKIKICSRKIPVGDPRRKEKKGSSPPVIAFKARSRHCGHLLVREIDSPGTIFIIAIIVVVFETTSGP